MLGKRVASAVIGALLLIGVVIWGINPLRIGVSLISGLMVYELLKAHGLFEKKIFSAVGMIAALILSSAVLRDNYIIPFLLLYMAVLFSFLIFNKDSFKTEDIAILFFFTVFIGLCMSCITRTRAIEGGKVWIIFIAAWGSDTAAYTFGNLFGKHKLIPAVSPHKTIEGAVGGIIGSILCLLIFSIIVKDTENLFKYCLLGAVASCFAQLGDLSASVIKRKAGIKDFGNIMPGHGGMMDRFDSILLTAPLVYYFIRYFLER